MPRYFNSNALATRLSLFSLLRCVCSLSLPCSASLSHIVTLLLCPAARIAILYLLMYIVLHRLLLLSK